MTTAPQAGDCIGGYVVLEFIEDYWRPGEHALIVEEASELDDGDRQWVLREAA